MSIAGLLLLSQEQAPSISMGIALLGGLALFLFGLEQMTQALKLAAGDRLKGLIERFTTNRFSAVMVGTVVTSIIQSSSVTTVLVVGFVSAGVMTLPQSIGVIMGASIGTTITAQIVVFKVTEAALGLVALGFALQFLSRSISVQRAGGMVLGIGLVFVGMNTMGDATAPLRSYPPFVDAIQHLDSPLIGILLSAGFTALVQSSSATTVLLIMLAQQGLIDLQQAIPFVFGANIGTCVTALLASVGKSTDAIRAALVHVIFNVGGVVIWLIFIPQLAWIVTHLSDDPSRQIAHAHTVFNVGSMLIFIGFTPSMARLVVRLIPDRPVSKSEAATPKYLDDLLIETPGLAIDSVRRELGRMGTAALLMTRSGLNAVVAGNENDFERLRRLDDDVDSLHEAIVAYVARLAQPTLTAQQTQRLQHLLLIANYLENIGDLIENQLIVVGKQRFTARLMVSDETRHLLEAIHHQVTVALEQAIRAVVDADGALAQEVVDAKEQIHQRVSDAELHLSRRLTAAAPQRLLAYRLESEIMEYLKRVYYIAKRIAHLVLDEAAGADKPNPPSEAEVSSSQEPASKPIEPTAI